MTYTISVGTVKAPDDGQMNCPKHVEFYSKNKFEKLVHLVGFIIRIYHDAGHLNGNMFVVSYLFNVSASRVIVKKSNNFPQ